MQLQTICSAATVTSPVNIFLPFFVIILTDILFDWLKQKPTHTHGLPLKHGDRSNN